MGKYLLIPGHVSEIDLDLGLDIMTLWMHSRVSATYSNEYEEKKLIQVRET